LIDDPDKYVVACLDGLVAPGIGTEHACAMGVAALFVGIKGRADTLSADGRVVTNWERFRRRSNAGTLEGRVTTLRAKRRRYRSVDDLRWRAAMGAAFQAVFTGADQQQAKHVALAAAMIVGEAEFAREVLWRMIDARFFEQFCINAGEPALS
jgi:hypothetical protein